MRIVVPSAAARAALRRDAAKRVLLA